MFSKNKLTSMLTFGMKRKNSEPNLQDEEEKKEDFETKASTPDNVSAKSVKTLLSDEEKA